MSTSFQRLLNDFPIGAGFRFITGILEAGPESLTGYHTFSGAEKFYEAHFPGRPITPGVILTEVMAQIGLVAFGMHLNQSEGPNGPEGLKFGFTESQVRFRKPVMPGETVWVKSTLIFYRLGKLKVQVEMKNEEEEIVADGILAGIILRS